jgi:hypothetical protein
MSTTGFESQAPSGYADFDSYWAVEYHQGGRQTFEVNLPLSSIPRFVTAPDPNKVIEGNRRVDVRHARGIAEYVRNRANGLIPTIVLRCPSGTLDFEPNPDYRAGGGVRFGILRIPKSKVQDLHIVDGQHRVLGLEIATQDISKERMALKSAIVDAQNLGNLPVKKELEEDLQTIEDQLARISRERVTVQVVVVDSTKEFKQIFVDLNDTAKGVKLSQVIQFDSSNPLYSASIQLAEHRLFAGKTGRDRDNVGKQSSDFVSLAHLLQFVKTASFGIEGRVSIARMKEISRDVSPLVRVAHAAVDRLVEAFPLLDNLSTGAVTPAEAREQSPLARANTLRVLIGADWALRTLGVDAAEIPALFTELSDELSGPFTRDNRLFQASGSAFPLGAMAPGTQKKPMKDAVNVIVGFCVDPKSAPETWLDAGRGQLAAATAAGSRK